MKALLTIARKDLKLLTRNRASFFWVLLWPILIALLFGFMFSGGGGRPSLPIAVIDQDQSEYSRSLVQRLHQSEALRIRETTLDSAVTAVRHGDLTAYVALRPGMSENFGFGGDSTSGIEIGIDPRQRPTADMLRGLVTQAIFLNMRQSFGSGGPGRMMIARSLEKMRADTTASTDRRARNERVLRSLESFMTVLDSVESRPDSSTVAGRASDSTGAMVGDASDSTGLAAAARRML